MCIELERMRNEAQWNSLEQYSGHTPGEHEENRKEPQRG